MRRTITILLCSIGLTALVLAPVANAKQRTPHRTGGKVTLAWPKTTKGTAGRVPKRAMARWLAHQIGPVKLTPKQGSARGSAAASVAPRAMAATAASATGAPLAKAAETPNFVVDGPSQKLQLVRSFDIPTDDPAYKRLQNLSFTYDSAIGAIAFLGAGYRAQAEMLLDQLAALQRTDGSLDLAYDTANGESARTFRTGTVAWVGLAASTYRDLTGSKRYDALQAGAARWLLTQQREDGLLRGGPDVSWVSTQNNIVAADFLSNYSGTQQGIYRKQGRLISDQVVEQLLVGDHFIQGVGDDVRPTDVQALGAMLLKQRGDEDTARRVLKAMSERARITGVSIVRSSDPTTYNMTYEAKGPFTAMRPYADAGSPDVIWFEWATQARIALDRMDLTDRAMNASLDAWTQITAPAGQGPLGSSATVDAPRFNEFHVWPAAAAGSWQLLQQTKPDLLLAS